MERPENPPTQQRGFTRRKFLEMVGAALAAALLASCSPEESSVPGSQQEPHHQIPPQIVNPNLESAEAHYRNFIEKYADRAVNSYVFDDQLLFEFSPDEGLRVHRNTLKGILLENPQEVRVLSRRLEVEVVIPKTLDNYSIQTLRALFNIPLDAPYTFYLQEIQIGNRTLFIPSSWMDYTKFKYNSERVILDPQKAKNLIVSIGESIIARNDGIGVRIEKKDLENAVRGIMNSPEVSRVDTPYDILEENDFIHFRELKNKKPHYKNPDVGILQAFSNNSEVESIKIVEIRTNYEGYNTRNSGRFLVVAKFRNGRVKILVLANNSNGAKVIINALKLNTNSNPFIHHALRHSIDLPTHLANDSNFQNLTGRIYENLAERIRNNNLQTGVLDLGGGNKIEIAEIIQRADGYEIKTVINFRGRQISYEYWIAKNGRFGTWYPMGNTRVGATIPQNWFQQVEGIKNKVGNIIGESYTSNTYTIISKDMHPLMFSIVGFYTTYLASRIGELSYYKKLLSEYIDKNNKIKDEIINLIRNNNTYFIIEIQVSENNTENNIYYIECFVHQITPNPDVSLRDEEFGHFFGSSLFTFESIFEINNNSYYINCGVIKKPEEFEKDVLEKGNFEEKQIDGLKIYIPQNKN